MNILFPVIRDAHSPRPRRTLPQKLHQKRNTDKECYDIRDGLSRLNAAYAEHARKEHDQRQEHIALPGGGENRREGRLSDRLERHVGADAERQKRH